MLGVNIIKELGHCCVTPDTVQLLEHLDYTDDITAAWRSVFSFLGNDMNSALVTEYMRAFGGGSQPPSDECLARLLRVNVNGAPVAGVADVVAIVVYLFPAVVATAAGDVPGIVAADALYALRRALDLWINMPATAAGPAVIAALLQERLRRGGRATALLADVLVDLPPAVERAAQVLAACPVQPPTLEAALVVYLNGSRYANLLDENKTVALDAVPLDLRWMYDFLVPDMTCLLHALRIHNHNHRPTIEAQNIAEMLAIEDDEKRRERVSALLWVTVNSYRRRSGTATASVPGIAIAALPAPPEHQQPNGKKRVRGSSPAPAAAATRISTCGGAVVPTVHDLFDMRLRLHRSRSSVFHEVLEAYAVSLSSGTTVASLGAAFVHWAFRFLYDAFIADPDRYPVGNTYWIVAPAAAKGHAFVYSKKPHAAKKDDIDHLMKLLREAVARGAPRRVPVSN